VVYGHELFFGFMRYYNSFNVTGEDTFTTNTRRILSYYDLLGRMLGYRVYSDKSMKNLNEDVPKSIERQRNSIE